jgi:hypothetical protein
MFVTPCIYRVRRFCPSRTHKKHTKSIFGSLNRIIFVDTDQTDMLNRSGWSGSDQKSRKFQMSYHLHLESNLVK